MKKFLRIFRLIGIPFIVAFGIYSFIRFVWIPNEKTEFKIQEINIEEYQKIYDESKESIIFITKTDFEKRYEYEEIVRQKFEDRNINVYYLNLTSMNDDELKRFESISNLDSEKEYILPILIYSLNGQVYDSLEGYQESHRVQQFIERNNIL